MPNYTILLVDYEPRSVERSRRPLIDAGFKVHLAPDGVAALEAFERLKPDLVLLEAMLPKKNGFEVCQELRQTPVGKNTPILITTAVYRGRKYRSQALHVHGASEYIEKPIADDQLVAIVRRFLQSSTKRPARIEEEAAPLPAPAKARPMMPAAATPATSATAPAVKAPAPAMAAAPSSSAPAPAVSAAKSATAEAAPAMAGAAVMVANTGSSNAESTTPRAERAVSAVVATPAEQMSALLGSGSAAGGSAASSATWRAAANAMAGALTEDEISERLDALLPLGPDDSVGSSSRADVAKDEPEAEAFDLEAAADVLAETDPDFDAGSSMNAAMMTEPVVPMVPAESTDIAEQAGDVLPAEDRPDADVVRFDARRSKKRGKKSKHKHEPAPQASSSPQVESAPLTIEPRPIIATAPISTPIASKSAAMEEMPAPRRRSMAIWVWLLVVAAIAVAAYFLFFRSDLRVTEERTPAPANVAANNPPPSPTTSERPSATPASEELPVDGLPVAESASTNSLASEPMQDATKPASDSEATATPAPSRSSPSLPAKKRPSPKGNEVLKADLAERTVSSSAMSPAMRLPEPASVPSVPAPSAMPANQTAPAPSPSAASAMRTEIKTPQPEVAVEAATYPPPAPAETSPARPVKEGDLVALTAADQPPIAVSRPAPAYPKKARTDGEEGEVSLSLLIDETGRVADLRIVNADTDDFGSAASKVARTWKYKPAMKNGVRIKVWKPERVIFKL